MNPSVASVICACLIAVLLYLDRDNTVRVSKALWLPGIWLGIDGSRPLSLWLNPNETTYSRTEGSPLDAAVFGVLIILAIGVLLRRRRRAQVLLAGNWPVLLYLLVGLVSISWAYYPDIAFKHWVKAVGDVAMVFVIATDAEPLAAIRRLVSRIGMLLFPTSVLFIRYLPDLGRGYTDAGLLMNTGVTTNKNSLGLIVLVISVTVLWNVRSLFIHKDEPNRGRRLMAQATVLVFGLALFWMADSSTSKACFFLGALIIITLNLRVIRRQPSRVHVVYLFIMLAAGAAFLFGGQADVADALGRDANLSGRTEIWKAVIPAVPNSIVGAGFESFWVSPNVQIFQRTLLESGWYPPLVKVLNEAHNGYIEVYLNLGWIGVCLIALVLAVGYKRASKAFRFNPELGSLFFAYVAIAAVYGITEAAFRFMCLAWIFLLLAMAGATGVTAGFFGQKNSKVPVSNSDELLPEAETYNTVWQEFHSH